MLYGVSSEFISFVQSEYQKDESIQMNECSSSDTPYYLSRRKSLDEGFEDDQGAGKGGQESSEDIGNAEFALQVLSVFVSSREVPVIIRRATAALIEIKVP